MPFNDPPWHPISDPVDIKHLGKLGEEVNELGSAISRCLIQGLDGLEPKTNKANRQWLSEEVVDVLVGIELLDTRFNLQIWQDPRYIERYADKLRNLRRWHLAA